MPNSGLDAMIDSDRIDDLARMYRLFTKVSPGLPTLKRALRETVIRRGRQINEAGTSVADGGDSQEEEVPEPSSKAKGKAKARPPNATSQTLTLALKWVQDVLDLKDKFDKIWTRSFLSDRELESSLNEVCPSQSHLLSPIPSSNVALAGQAFETFINQNEKAPEYISLFIDENLKKGLKGVGVTLLSRHVVLISAPEIRYGGRRGAGQDNHCLPLHHRQGRFRTILQRSSSETSLDGSVRFRRCRARHARQT